MLQVIGCGLARRRSATWLVRVALAMGVGSFALQCNTFDDPPEQGGAAQPQPFPPVIGGFQPPASTSTPTPVTPALPPPPPVTALPPVPPTATVLPGANDAGPTSTDDTTTAAESPASHATADPTSGATSADDGTSDSPSEPGDAGAASDAAATSSGGSASNVDAPASRDAAASSLDAGD